ncbi:cytochrome c-type biogenesis CcmF C-terminal domain-containing protein, partial [Escherichia coli]|uniref:cytochrome c-type biogenesis CcmF C-terminal domain-containing protein n=1 Tax=Escherichia coli TaxID=562 RepID=UPI0025A6843D
WGTALAHAGIGVMLIGIVGETAYRQELIVQVRPGQTVSIAGFDLTFDGMTPRDGPNYRDQVARLRVSEGGVPAGILAPAKRVYT